MIGVYDDLTPSCGTRRRRGAEPPQDAGERLVEIADRAKSADRTTRPASPGAPAT